MSEVLTVEEKLKKIHEIVFSIICDIDDFCNENEIRYYLSGGTCLGAVRHKGFIPWDDDADLMMPRPDYERFLNLFSKKHADKYSVGSLKTSSTWQRPFARVCDLNSRLTPTRFHEESMGIFVDIFPIDGLPDKKILQSIHYKYIRLQNIFRTSSIRTAFKEGEGHRLVKTIAKFVSKNKGPRVYAEKIDKLAQRYNFETSKEVAAILALHYWDKETISKKCMDRSKQLLFEGRKFPVPIGYKQYLTNLYGDYMTPPEGGVDNVYSHLNGWKIEFDIIDEKRGQ